MSHPRWRRAQVMRSANQRLLALQPPAVDALAEALDADTHQLNRRGEVVGLGPDYAVRIRAATASSTGPAWVRPHRPT